MADYIYDAEGRPQAFRLGKFLYRLDGDPVGRVWAERVYRFDGTYVGALLRNMVLDKPTAVARGQPPADPPPSVSPLRGGESRRPMALPFGDVFHLLALGGAGSRGEGGHRAAAEARTNIFLVE